MEVIVEKDATSASATAARVVARLVRSRPDAVLGLASGATPIPLYEELVRVHRHEGLDFARVTTFSLDEYVGLGRDHPQSYARFLREHLLDPVGVPEGAAHSPDGLAADIPGHCRAYEDAIRAAGGIDLQILGIGADGHIAFNEPGSSLASRTRIKTITEGTRRNNARHFASEEEVPLHVITMGVGTILDARTCLLLAFGSGKARAVAAAVEGAVTASVPASALQFHPDVKVFLDAAAASDLSRIDYYRWVYDRKPDWQKF
jgi:glucosamine-6-phosphate deaminase